MEAVIILAAALTVGLFLFSAYRQGIKDGMRFKSGKAPEPIVKERPKSGKAKEDRRLNTILSNIDAYDGTGKGQKDINI